MISNLNWVEDFYFLFVGWKIFLIGIQYFFMIKNLIIRYLMKRTVVND